MALDDVAAGGTRKLPMLDRRRIVGLGAAGLVTAAGVRTAGWVNILLGAANLIENGDASVSESAYGTAPRQQYDVYRPAATPLGEARPVVMFVHGGSWQSGDKSLYRFVGQALAQLGFIAVLPNYGLMPEQRFPGFVQDVAQAFAHAHARVAAWGGDPTRVFVMGHSAGAHIAALLCYDARYLAAHQLSTSNVTGYIGLSGPYDFVLDSDLLRATFAGPAEREYDAQPVHFATADSPPSLLVMGRDDTTVRPRNTTSLAARLRSVGGRVEELWVPGEHGATVGAFARVSRSDSVVVDRVGAFVRNG